MKLTLAIGFGVFAISWAGTTFAADQALDAVDSLYPEAPAATEPSSDATSQGPAQMEQAIEPLTKRIKLIEARLGPSSRPPSVAYNVERRLTDLEKRIQKLEQQQSQMQQWERRIRRLEMK